MNKILEAHLIKKYPKMFVEMYGDRTKTCMAYGCTYDADGASCPKCGMTVS